MFLYLAKLGLRQRNIPPFDDWRTELDYELLDDVSAHMHMADLSSRCSVRSRVL
jgi:hypothetical protein